MLFGKKNHLEYIGPVYGSTNSVPLLVSPRFLALPEDYDNDIVTVNLGLIDLLKRGTDRRNLLHNTEPPLELLLETGIRGCRQTAGSSSDTD